MKKNLAILFVFLLTAIGVHAQLEKAPLYDMGGQIISLYGFADYKLVADSLKSQSQGLIPIPFNEMGLPAVKADGTLDFAAAKYAAIGLVRYEANYAFASTAPVDPMNPTGIVAPRKTPQFFISHFIINPAAFHPIYKMNPNDLSSVANPKYNPDYPSLLFTHLLTSDKDFAVKGRSIWTNPWEVAKGGDFKLNYNLKNLDQTTAVGAFSDISGTELLRVKMGVSKVKKSKLVHRNYKSNAIATSHVETTLYPITALDAMIEREFDPAVDSMVLGGPVKTYMESLKFMPTLWQNSIQFNSNVYFNYATGK